MVPEENNNAAIVSSAISWSSKRTQSSSPAESRSVHLVYPLGTGSSSGLNNIMLSFGILTAFAPSNKVSKNAALAITNLDLDTLRWCDSSNGLYATFVPAKIPPAATMARKKIG